MSVAVHQYTYQHISLWTQPADPSRGLFGTHISTLVFGLSTLALPMDCLGDFGPRGLSVQFTQDVRGCPSAHTGRPWLSVCVRVCPSAHTVRPWLSISTHISTLVLGLSTLALPVDCLGDFSPRGLSVQYTQDVCGFSPAHTGHLWLSVASTHRTSVAVRVYLCLSVGVPHTGRLWLSINTHISTLVLGLSTLALPVDSLGDFCPRGLSVQYTQDVCGCPPAHTERLWLQHTQDVRGCPSVDISARWSLDSAWWPPVDCSGDFGPRGLSVQYTQDVRGCPSAHTGCPCESVSSHRTSVAVRVCPCVSVSTHKTSMAVHQYIYQNYTQDVRGCPCVSVCVRQHTQDVRGCPSVHISARCTHRTSVGVRQHTHDVRGCPWLAHTGHLWQSVSTDRTSVGVRQHTQDVRVCPTSVAVRVCPCVSVNTHWTSVAVQHTHRTSVVVRQHTQDVRVGPSAHTGRPWLSVSTQDIRGRPWLSVSTQDIRGRPWLSVSTQDIRGRPWLKPLASNSEGPKDR
ncbi:hypothetical protein YC2023_066218 [Brassica napus]